MKDRPKKGLSRRDLLQLGLATTATTLLPGGVEFAFAPQAYAQGQDPLPSWNNGAAKKGNHRFRSCHDRSIEFEIRPA
jgi:TAT (twin-arginine translocation) pathway signal sequence